MGNHPFTARELLTKAFAGSSNENPNPLFPLLPASVFARNSGLTTRD